MVKKNMNSMHKMLVPDGLAGLVRAAQDESNVDSVDATPTFVKEKMEATPKAEEHVASSKNATAKKKIIREVEVKMVHPDIQKADALENVDRAAVAKEAVEDIPASSMTFEKKRDSWLMFKGFLLDYKKDTSKGKEIWINDDIRYELDKIKTASRSSMKLKTMVNAMLQTFLVMHKDEIQELLAKE
jgi:hypothetical protein